MEFNTLTESPGIANFPVHRVERGSARTLADSIVPDLIAVEEPLEIRVGGRSISITMRTPGQDAELAAGFLFTEGMIHEGRDIESVKAVSPNVVNVTLRPEVTIDLDRLKKNFYTTSSCGVCGKSSIDRLRTRSRYDARANDFQCDAEVIHRLPGLLRETQGVFDATGGIHASALFTGAGKLLALREDVGRHNALDKLIGHALFRSELPLEKTILTVSGRASFELVQKASMAGVGIFAAVGAPSSLAVELARDCGMTLLGFVRDARFNVYSHEGRLRFGRDTA